MLSAWHMLVTAVLSCSVDPIVHSLVLNMFYILATDHTGPSKVSSEEEKQKKEVCP